MSAAPKNTKDADRLKAYREVKRALGQQEFHCWLPKDLHEKVRLYAQKLAKREVKK